MLKHSCLFIYGLPNFVELRRFVGHELLNSGVVQGLSLITLGLGASLFAILSASDGLTLSCLRMGVCSSRVVWPIDDSGSSALRIRGHEET